MISWSRRPRCCEGLCPLYFPHPEWGVQGTSGGTTSYSYDGASNLLSKTDARGVIVSYNSYDGLNRPASISCSDGTATASFTYDSTGVTHGKGRRTGMSDGSGSTAWHYDALGRTSKILRTVSGASPPTPNPLTGEFIYNPAGGIKESRWPGIWDGSTPLTIYWSYDNSGRQVSANWSNNGGGAFQNLVTSSTLNHYNYTGKSSSDHSREITTYSNNAVETITYNYRMQPNWREVKDGAALTVMLLEYNYNRNTAGQNDGKNNGNVFNVYDRLNAARDQAYAYDYLNRVTSYTGILGGSMTFGYDRYGNRPTQTGSGEAPSKSLTISAAQNRITSSGYFYDNTGNMKDEPGWTYQYDAENRMKTVNSGTIATYSYDGDGKRTKKVTATETRYYYYDQDGRPIWEYKTGYGFETYNFYFNGQHAASNNSGNSLLWLHSDHLGSPRVKTKPNGQILTDASAQPIHDRYYPFGQQINVPADTVKYDFTGKERDAESGLDYFGVPFFGSHLGRFSSVDPAPIDRRILSTPQRWNKYSYVINNPLARLDLQGLTDIHFLISRWVETDKSTTGVLLVYAGSKNLSGFTLELPDKGNKQYVSRIPARVYKGEKCTTKNCPSMGTNRAVFKLLDVPGRDGIQIHPGNTPARTKGCILLGCTVSTDFVGDSRTKVAELKKLLMI